MIGNDPRDLERMPRLHRGGDFDRRDLQVDCWGQFDHHRDVTGKVVVSFLVPFEHVTLGAEAIGIRNHDDVVGSQ